MSRKKGSLVDTLMWGTLKLVVCELRFSGAGAGAATYEPLSRLLRSRYPLEAAPLDPGAEADPGDFAVLAKDRTASVAVAGGSLVVQATARESDSAFVDRVAEAVRALGRCAEVGSVERVGLRHVFELSLSSLPGGAASGFLASPLAAVASPQAEFATVVSHVVDRDRHALVRAGCATAPVVDPSQPLRVPLPSPPPLAFLDVDCVWTARHTWPLPFDGDVVGDALQALGDAAVQLIRRSVADELLEPASGSRQLARQPPQVGEPVSVATLAGATATAQIALPWVSAGSVDAVPLEGASDVDDHSVSATRGAEVELLVLIAQCNAQSADVLADRLMGDFGLSAALTARATGLSVSSVRAWSSEAAIADRHRWRLAEFAAMCTLVVQLDSEIEKLDRWWRAAVAAEPDKQRIDLYLEGRWADVAAIAAR